MTKDVKLTTRIPADLLAWLATKACENDRSQNQQIVSLIRAARRADDKHDMSPTTAKGIA